MQKTLIENMYGKHQKYYTRCSHFRMSHWSQQLLFILPLLLPRLLPELCFTGEVSGDVRISSRDRGGAPQAGDTGDPQAEAGHNITECDNLARCHLTLFAVADL